jgi:hypothetical protein
VAKSVEVLAEIDAPIDDMLKAGTVYAEILLCRYRVYLCSIEIRYLACRNICTSYRISSWFLSQIRVPRVEASGVFPETNKQTNKQLQNRLRPVNVS